MMRILWIRRGASSADAGDSIYDDKLQHALADRFTITNCLLTRNTRPRQLLHAALTLNMPEQFGSGTPADEARVRALLPAHDLAIFSHEHLDHFARAMRPHTQIPFLAIRQNVTSDAMASILSDRPLLARLYRAGAARQERATLCGPLFDAVTAISIHDQRLLRALSGRDDIPIVMPGAPPAAALHESAAPARELVVSGTFDWFPKARDVRRFVQDYAARPVEGARVYCAPGIPADLAALIGAAREDSFDPASAIRFGVITDRFSAGHKLKTAAYLMNNCAVISFARVSEDFAAFPLAKRWIFEVQNVAEIGPVMDQLVSRPAEETRAELVALKSEIAATLSWKRQAEALEGAIDATRLKRDARLNDYTA